MSSFAWLTLAGWLLVVSAAAMLRNRRFATFVGVLVGTYSLIALAISTLWVGPSEVLTALHVTVYVNFALLARPRMRQLPFRLLISWPSAFFAAGTLFALPWAIAVALGFHPWAAWIPYVLSAVGIVQSLRTSRELVHLTIGGPSVETLAPHPHGSARQERPLRIVQITDPHLGPFMSVARLRSIAQRAVDDAPDLVFLTGDFLTMESQSDPQLLSDALEPLRALKGRVFACHGNHDHEAPAVVLRACRINGIRLLVDESTTVETEAGKVQIVGMDFMWRDRENHMARVCAEHPREPGALRVILLHDTERSGICPRARETSCSRVTRMVVRSAS